IAKPQAAGNNHRIIGDDVAWDGDGWSFGVTSGIMRFTRNGIIDADDPSGTAIPTGQWVHIAATPTSTGINFYLNGVLTGTNANGSDNNTGLGNNGVADVYGIGRSYGNAQDQFFPGLIDEIRVYDTVLTQSEIANLATAVPEPSAGLLIGLAGLAAAMRRRRA
ncbi:LamG domain-containing protein, partial [bacterium]|nr:LamG domain-containing protein [bacterium]